MKENINKLLNGNNLDSVDIARNLKITGNGSMQEGVKVIFREGKIAGEKQGFAIGALMGAGAFAVYICVDLYEEYRKNQEKKKIYKVIVKQKENNNAGGTQ